MARHRSSGPRPPRVMPMGEAIHHFNHHQDVDFRIGCAEQLARSRRTGDTVIAGEMFVETARDDSLSVLEKQALLEQGREHWERIAARSPGDTAIQNQWIGQAAIRLAVFPSLSWLVAGKRLPPLAQTEKDYAALLGTSNRLVTGRDTVRDTNARSHLSGQIAEASVQLLLMRFVLGHQDTEYGSHFSFLSEDQAGNKGSTSGVRWDISAYTHYEREDEPVVKHRIQVKSSKRGAATGYVYDETEVSMVHVSDDLALGRRALRGTTIIAECTAEAAGNGSHTEILDKRTDRLLDKI